MKTPALFVIGHGSRSEAGVAELWDLVGVLREDAPAHLQLDAGFIELVEPDLGKLASAWHTDLDLGREIEVVTDMTKSRLAGFHEYQPTLGSFLDLFARLRRERIIPSW